MPRKPVNLDTDAGVDDAMAIILALRSPELDVQAITTVAGNVGVDKCTKNVLRVLSLMALTEYPIVAEGAERPLVRAPFTAGSVHGEDGLGELGDAYYPELPTGVTSDLQAVDLMLQLIGDSPGEITLIATGPLTNVARAIRKDPRTMAQVKEIVFMGGAVHVPGNIPPGAAEFNIFVDPHAAEVVLGFPVSLVMVPLDVTHQVKLMRTAVEWELGSRAARVPRFIADATRKYMRFYRDDQGHDGCYLHDLLAVGVAIDPSFVTTEAMRIYVETEGKVTAGMTLPFRHPTRDPAKREAPNVRVCNTVDAERFLQLFLKCVRN
jgi:purine nucleosidase/pyrimidine-specific ribonucleoside hydrolase